MSRGFLVLALAAVPFAALAAPVPKATETPPQRLARLFGEPTLPDDTCKADLKDGVLRLTAGGTDHVWQAGAGGMKVPFVTREVKGDFAVTVVAKAVDLPETGSVTGVAGLFVMKDDTTTVDHSLYLTGNAESARRRGWLRYSTGGNQVSTKEDASEAFAGDEVALKVERAGTKLTASVARVGKEWAEVDSFEMDLDRTAKVGVFVAHTGGPFAAEFRDFHVTAK